MNSDKLKAHIHESMPRDENTSEMEQLKIKIEQLNEEKDSLFHHL
jgi:hypothetical protein